METGMMSEKSPDTHSTMGQSPVPEKNDVAAHMTQEIGEEFHHLWGANILV